jgi:hypothetical protein
LQLALNTTKHVRPTNRPANTPARSLVHELARGLPAGSRLVIAAENQSVELTCDASEALVEPAGAVTPSRGPPGAAQDKQRPASAEFLVVDSNRREPLLVAYDGEPAGASTPPSQDTAGHQQQLQQQQQTRLRDEEPADYLVSLVFWYKDDNPAPIYTLDARQPMTAPAAAAAERLLLDGVAGWTRVAETNRRLLAAARHYHGGKRTTAATQAGRQIRDGLKIKTDNWPVIKLQLAGVGPAQAGDYKCRVDFRRARTIRRTSRLFVEGRRRRPRRAERMGPAAGKQRASPQRRGACTMRNTNRTSNQLLPPTQHPINRPPRTHTSAFETPRAERVQRRPPAACGRRPAGSGRAGPRQAG